MLKETSLISKDLMVDIPQIHHLYKNLFSHGKNLRANMTFHIAQILNIPKEKALKLSRIVEYIHQSSILHDDVIDMSPIRRGALSSWMQYSMKKAVLAGDYLLGVASSNTADMQNIALTKLTAETLKKLVEGEWRQSFIKGKETLLEVNNIHALKTASLFQWILKAPFLVIEQYEKSLHNTLDQIGLRMGVLFQRADDLLDFDIRNKEKKAIFKDLSAGFFNSFAVHLIETQDSNLRSTLKTCKSLNQLKKIVGEKIFKTALSSFDEINQKMILDCENKVLYLKQKIDKDQKALLDYLVKWPKKLYWR